MRWKAESTGGPLPAIAAVLERFLHALAAGDPGEIDRLVLPGGVFSLVHEAFGLEAIRRLIGPLPGRSLVVKRLRMEGKEARLVLCWSGRGGPLSAVLRRHGPAWRIDEAHAVDVEDEIRAEELGPERTDLYLGRTELPLRIQEPAAAGFLRSVYDELRRREFPLSESAAALVAAREIWQDFREHGLSLLECLRLTPVNRVFSACRGEEGERLALKVANTADPEILAHFQRETEILAALAGHPQVPALLEHGSWQSAPYLLCAWAQGERLADRLRRGLDLSRAERLRIGLATAALLRDLHARGIFHRDVAPDHLFVDERGQVQILDFGMARRHGPEETAAARAGARMDIFCLGLVLCELLLGAPVFRYHHPALAEQVPDALGRLERLGPDRQVLATIRRALAAAPEKYLRLRVPDDPYASVDQLAADLDRCLSGSRRDS